MFTSQIGGSDPLRCWSPSLVLGMEMGKSIVVMIMGVIVCIAEFDIDQVDRSKPNAALGTNLFSEGANLPRISFKEYAFETIAVVEPNEVRGDDDVVMGMLHL